MDSTRGAALHDQEFMQPTRTPLIESNLEVVAHQTPANPKQTVDAQGGYCAIAQRTLIQLAHHHLLNRPSNIGDPV